MVHSAGFEHSRIIFFALVTLPSQFDPISATIVAFIFYKYANSFKFVSIYFSRILNVCNASFENKGVISSLTVCMFTSRSL